jgi:hypothetical protein
MSLNEEVLHRARTFVASIKQRAPDFDEEEFVIAAYQSAFSAGMMEGARIERRRAEREQSGK